MIIAGFVMALVALAINGLMWLFIIIDAYEEYRHKRKQKKSATTPKTSSDCNSGWSDNTENLDKLVE